MEVQALDVGEADVDGEVECADVDPTDITVMESLAAEARQELERMLPSPLRTILETF